MTALEIRLIAYALLALLILGGAGWVGHRLTAIHYEALIAKDRQSQDKAIQDAQQRVIAAQAAQDSARQQAEQKYADLKSNYDGLSQRLADSVRALSAQLHSGTMPKIPGAPTGVTERPAGAGSDQRLADLSGTAAESCLRDAAALAALQAWVKSLTLGESK